MKKPAGAGLVPAPKGDLNINVNFEAINPGLNYSQSQSQFDITCNMFRSEMGNDSHRN